MAESAAARANAVRRLVRAARRLAEAPGALETRLVAETGLSRENVIHGLRRHLEIDPGSDEVESLVANAGDAAEVVVILSANVFTAALRAIALARAAAPRVRVRPSRRDPAFAEALVAEVADPAITLAPDFVVASAACGEVHVYGRDETVAAVAAGARPGVVVRGHGAGLGVAYVGPEADLDKAAERLARDVVPFDQRGCLSPRVALVHDMASHERSHAFARALDDALAALEKTLPRGRLSDGERADARRYLETMLVAGEVHEGASHVVGLATTSGAMAIPPAGRHVHIVGVRGEAHAAAVLSPIANAVVAVGHEGGEASAFAPAHARVSRLGEMQRPKFDGPVDRRVNVFGARAFAS